MNTESTNYQTLEFEETDLWSEASSSESAQSIQSNDSNNLVLNPDGSLMKGIIRSL